jgi:hypothetical protein
MIKYCIYFLIIGCFISCATTGSYSEKDKSNAKSDSSFPINFPKTICFPLGYSVFNISNDEDIKLLVNEQPNFLKKHFNTSLEKLLKKDKISIIDDNCSYTLKVRELTFREFKIEVSGPYVNVATVRIDYHLNTPNMDTVLFDMINKESISDFDQTIFEEMCEELSKDVMTNIRGFLK